MELRYSVKAGGVDLWANLLAIAAIVAVAGGVFVAIVESTTAGIIVAVALAATVLVIWPIVPRRYEIWSDHLSLVFPMWQWDMSFDSIAHVRESTKWEPYAFIGWRFATAPSKAVTIERRDANMFTRPSVVISPDDRPKFIQELRAALERSQDAPAVRSVG